MKKQIRITAYLLSFIFLFLSFSETVDCYEATKIREIKISSLEVFDGQEKQIQITGVFENNAILDITDSVKLKVEDESILKVKNKKVLVGEKIGKTNLIVTYQGKETNLSIEVKEDLSHFRKPVPKEKFSFRGIRNENSIDFSWLETQDMKSYKIYKSDSDENSYKVIANNITSFEYTDKIVDLNHVYYYKISGIHTNGTEEQLSKLKFELPQFQEAKPKQAIENVVIKNNKKQAEKTALNLINNDKSKKYLEALKKTSANSYNEEEYTKLLQALMKLNSEKDENIKSENQGDFPVNEDEVNKNQGDIPKGQSEVNKGQGDIPVDGVDPTKNQGDVIDKDNIFSYIISITADEFNKSNEVVLKYRDKDLALKNEETLKLYRLDEVGNYIDPVEIQVDKVSKEIKFKVSSWGKYILDDKQVSKDKSKSEQNDSTPNNSEEKLNNSVAEENKGANNNSTEKKESKINTVNESLKEKEVANSSAQKVDNKEVEQKDTTKKQENEKIPAVDKKESNTTAKESEKINNSPAEVKADKSIEDNNLNKKKVSESSVKEIENKESNKNQNNEKASTSEDKSANEVIKNKTANSSEDVKNNSGDLNTKTSSKVSETKDTDKKEVKKNQDNEKVTESKNVIEVRNSEGNKNSNSTEKKGSPKEEVPVKAEGEKINSKNYDDFAFLVTLAGLLKESDYQVDFDDISKIENNIPKEGGIWIIPKDRNYIRDLINKISSKKYYIDSNGYLKEDLAAAVDKNKSLIYSDMLDKLINSGKKIIIGQNNQWLEYDKGIDKINPRFFSTENDGVTIDYKGEKQIIIINKEGLNVEDNKDNSLDIVLAHEFIHTSFLQKNEIVEETNVVSFENRIRKELNYNIRGTEVDSTRTKDEYKYGDALYQGDTGDEVIQLQNDLLSIGFDLGGYGATGTYGGYTVAVIKAIQEYRAISITGNYGPATKAALQGLLSQLSSSSVGDFKSANQKLFDIYDVKYKPSISYVKGDSGQPIVDLQKNLILLGMDLGGSGATGTFGDYTEAAVKAVQEYNGIEVIGSYGPKTNNAVIAMLHGIYDKNRLVSLYNKYVGQISLTKGSTGVLVIKKQEKLIQLGLDLGGAGATGNYGDYTEAAVKAVQEYNGIEVIGSCGPKTSSAIENMLANGYDKNKLLSLYNKYLDQISLAKGSSGPLVKKKQEKLLLLGLDLGGNGATGYYGDYTVAAVKAVQEYNGIEILGAYGPKTATAVQNMLSNGYDKNRLLGLYDKYLDQISLTKGSSGPLVKKKQEKLLNLGFDLGGSGATGYFGDYTEAAVKAVQEYNGIEIIGAYGPKTAAAIDNMLAKGYDKNRLLDLNNKYLDTVSLSKGSSGELVKRRQLKLLQLGLDLGGAGATGYFGDFTDAAVRAVQEYNGIEIIGVYGPKTAAAVNNMIANGYDSSRLNSYYGKYKSAFVADNTTINANASYGANIYYAQTDSRWANKLYSTHGDSSQTIGKSACGPASMSMIISNMTSSNVTPYDMSVFALNNDCRTYDSGTSSDMFYKAAARYGLSCVGYAKGALKQIKNILATGTNMVIASMNPGHFTSGGHYIVLQGIRTINGENYFEVLDPNWPNPNYSKNSDGKIEILSMGRVLASTSIFAQECGNGYWVFSGGNGSHGTSDNTGSSSNQGSSKNTTENSANPNLYINGKYDRVAAVQYATNPDYSSPDKNEPLFGIKLPDGASFLDWNKHTRSYNTDYERYDSYTYYLKGHLSGSDCANFVSQALFAGGVKQNGDWYFKWDEKEGPDNSIQRIPNASESWVRPDPQLEYLKSKGYIDGEILMLKSLGDMINAVKNLGVQIGDIIFLNNGSEGTHHSMLITRIDEDGVIYYSGHSNDRINQAITESVFEDDTVLIARMV